MAKIIGTRQKMDWQGNGSKTEYIWDREPTREQLDQHPCSSWAQGGPSPELPYEPDNSRMEKIGDELHTCLVDSVVWIGLIVAIFWMVWRFVGGPK